MNFIKCQKCLQPLSENDLLFQNSEVGTENHFLECRNIKTPNYQYTYSINVHPFVFFQRIYFSKLQIEMLDSLTHSLLFIVGLQTTRILCQFWRIREKD